MALSVPFMSPTLPLGQHIPILLDTISFDSSQVVAPVTAGNRGRV